MVVVFVVVFVVVTVVVKVVLVVVVAVEEVQGSDPTKSGSQHAGHVLHNTGQLFLKLGPMIESLQLAGVDVWHGVGGSPTPLHVAVVVVVVCVTVVVVVEAMHESQSIGHAAWAAGMAQ